MYEDKLIVTYNEKNKVLYVRSKQTMTLEQQIEFGHWYEVKDLNDDVLFSVQLIHEGGKDYVLNVQGIDEADQKEGYDIYDILNNQNISIFNGERKNVFVEVQVRNGEYEYNSKSVHQIPVEMKVEDFADAHARDFYGRFSYTDGDWHYFNGGEVAVRAGASMDVSITEYLTLKKFLI